jgi:hypothetical protein
MIATLCGLKGALEGLKTHMEVNSDDCDRMMALQHLDMPLKECKVAVSLVETRLKSVNLVGKYVVGKLWDRKLDKSLKKLDEAKQLLELSMHADQL